MFFKLVTDKWRVRSITLESPSPIRMNKRRQEFIREVLHYPNHEYDYEIVLRSDLRNSRELRKTIRRAHNSGLCVTIPKNPELSYQHFVLLEKYIHRWEPCPYFKAEFISSVFHLLGRQNSILTNCSRNGELLGFALACLLGTFGVLHMTITLNETSGISDLLYERTINTLRKQGAEVISLGFSLNKGLLQFKEKWGGERTWVGGYEIIWSANNTVPNYLWATRIARWG